MHQYPLLPDLKTCEDEEENEYWGYGTEGTPLSMCSNDECSRHLITVRTDDRSASISLVPFNSRSEGNRFPVLSTTSILKFSRTT